MGKRQSRGYSRGYSGYDTSGSGYDGGYVDKSDGYGSYDNYGSHDSYGYGHSSYGGGGGCSYSCCNKVNACDFFSPGKFQFSQAYSDLFPLLLALGLAAAAAAGGYFFGLNFNGRSFPLVAPVINDEDPSNF